MRKLNRCVIILVVLSFIFGCNPIQEMKEGREAAERSQKEAKIVLEKIKEYAERAEAAAQRAEKAAESSENSSRKAEAASQKAVESFEKHLKK
jgi:hypothetical protein